jgi:8-oxo-dGTP diphosphatase
MLVTTQVYLRRDHQTLMLYRNKKKNDLNEGKYIGVGGKKCFGETPYECAVRETYEETHYQIHSAKLVGIVTFCDDDYEEMMFIYTSDDFSGTMGPCDEGTLSWVDDDQLLTLNMWEADWHFIKWLDEDKLYSAKAIYHEGQLVNYEERVEVQ